MGVKTLVPPGPVSVMLKEARFVIPVIENCVAPATSKTTTKWLSDPAFPRAVAVWVQVNWVGVSVEFWVACPTPNGCGDGHCRKTLALNGPLSGAEDPWCWEGEQPSADTE